jgi:rRNA-processing protein FCF1
LPAEPAYYISHAKALVIARAKCIADAYTAFSELTGREAETELASFFATTVAARKSNFQGEAELRRVRTGSSTNQLVPLLRGFDRGANPALLEGGAILDRQRVEMKKRSGAAALTTKYVVDTCVFNWLADSLVRNDELPSDGGFAITHIQVDEINKTKDEERGQDFRFAPLKAELDVLNGSKENNVHDALIAEAAIANGYTLLTADGDLKSAAEKHAGKVIFFQRPIS